MRRLLLMFMAATTACALAACGNKGPLYRPPAKPAASTTASAPAPAPATSTASDDLGD